MKKCLFLLLAIILAAGCSQQKKAPLKINNYEISREEFNSQFKESQYGSQDTLESRKEFLDNLIDRKLILQDAQAKGLDKNPAFLKMIEKFWEQSLLKLALDAKSKEVANAASASDNDIAARYAQLQKEGRLDKPYEQMYGQIKWELIKEKETKMINDWVLQLRKKANVVIDDSLLKENK